MQLSIKKKKLRDKTHGIEAAYKALIALGFRQQVRTARLTTIARVHGCKCCWRICKHRCCVCSLACPRSCLSKLAD